MESWLAWNLPGRPYRSLALEDLPATFVTAPNLALVLFSECEGIRAETVVALVAGKDRFGMGNNGEGLGETCVTREALVIS